MLGRMSRQIWPLIDILKDKVFRLFVFSFSLVKDCSVERVAWLS